MRACAYGFIPLSTASPANRLVVIWCPKKVKRAQVKFSGVCAGTYHSCAIIETPPRSGQVVCWGYNEHGQAQSWDDLLEAELVEEGGRYELLRPSFMCLRAVAPWTFEYIMWRPVNASTGVFLVVCACCLAVCALPLFETGSSNWLAEPLTRVGPTYHLPTPC